jgi:hypothetical protein
MLTDPSIPRKTMSYSRDRRAGRRFGSAQPSFTDETGPRRWLSYRLLKTHLIAANACQSAPRMGRGLRDSTQFWSQVWMRPTEVIAF